MPQTQAALVMTTVNDLRCLESYLKNFNTHGHLEQVHIYVILDVATEWNKILRPILLEGFEGITFSFPQVNAQEEFLHHVAGLPAGFIARNSDHRRNVGYLMALADGCDFVMSIDDDCWCPEGVDFYGEHEKVCAQPSKEVQLNHFIGWSNVCRLLNVSDSTYARGYPYYARVKNWYRDGDSGPETTVQVKINAGLWLDHPDIDALSWIQLKDVGGYRKRATQLADSCSFCLGSSTWSPITSQNTAVHRDVIPAYYFVRMQHPDFQVDRFGDIFQGYFAEACAKYLGHSIRFGTPVVEHRRNPHNYLVDVYKEIPAILILEDLLPWLTEVKLGGTTYLGAYVNLSIQLEAKIEKFQGFIWTRGARQFLRDLCHDMRTWADACEHISGAEVKP